RYFLGGDFDIRGFDFRAISPIAFVVRNVNVIDSETGNSVARPFDDIVYVGGDTQGVMNIEYRIPVIGRIFTIAPYFDIGNAWVLKKDELTRQIINSDGLITREEVRFLTGTNSGFRNSTGIEFQVMKLVNNAILVLLVYMIY